MPKTFLEYRELTRSKIFFFVRVKVLCENNSHTMDTCCSLGSDSLKSDKQVVMAAVIHDFRAAYCSFVYCMFDCPHTFASTACDVVGHESIHESLSYNHIKLQGVGGAENSLGPLKLEAEGDNVEKEAAMLLLEFGKG